MVRRVRTTRIHIGLAFVLLGALAVALAAPALTPAPAAADPVGGKCKYSGPERIIQENVFDSKMVRHAQCLLNLKFDADLVVDGDFGPKTRDAVETVQRTQGLKVDGIVGPCTWYVLHNYPYDYPDDPTCYR